MLTNPKRFEDTGFLRRDAHRALRLLRRSDRIQAEDFHAARSRSQLGRDLAQEGCLARAVRSENGHKFSAPHFEIDSAIGFGPVAILLHETTHTDCGACAFGRRKLSCRVKFFRDRLVDFADYRSAQGFSTSQLNCMKSIADRIAVSGLLR